MALENLKSLKDDMVSKKWTILRGALFKHFCNNPEISFCYSLDSTKENDDATILKNFANNDSM